MTVILIMFRFRKEYCEPIEWRIRTESIHNNIEET